MHKRQTPDQIVPFERHLEEEPERSDGGVDARRAHMGLRHVQLIQTKILAGGGIRRAAEEGREVPDVADVVLLGLLREMTRRHVFDHALTQRADGLVGHDENSCLTRGYEPGDLETGRAAPLPRHPICPERAPVGSTARAV